MPQRADGMETVLWTIEMLQRIPTQCKITANELQSQLADTGYLRNLRSIQWQLRQITGHFDVECDDRSKPLGYRWKEKSKVLSLPSLNQYQSQLLALAEKPLHNLLIANLMAATAPYFHLARSNLQDSSKVLLKKEWLQKVRMLSATQPLLLPAVNEAIFSRISPRDFLRSPKL